MDNVISKISKKMLILEFGDTVSVVESGLSINNVFKLHNHKYMIQVSRKLIEDFCVATFIEIMKSLVADSFESTGAAYALYSKDEIILDYYASHDININYKRIVVVRSNGGATCSPNICFYKLYKSEFLKDMKIDCEL